MTWKKLTFIGTVVDHGNDRRAIHIPKKITEFYSLFTLLEVRNSYGERVHYKRQRAILRINTTEKIFDNWLDIHKTGNTLRLVCAFPRNPLDPFVGMLVQVEIEL